MKEDFISLNTMAIKFDFMREHFSEDKASDIKLENPKVI